MEYLNLGKPEKAAAVARTAVELDASSSLSQSILARSYLEIGNDAQLRHQCSNAQDRRADDAMLHASCYLLAFLENDEGAMQKQIEWSHGNAAESEVLDDVAWVAMFQGAPIQPDYDVNYLTLISRTGAIGYCYSFCIQRTRSLEG